MADHDIDDAARQNYRGIKPCLAPEQSRTGKSGHQHAGETGQGRPQPGSPFTFAESLVSGGSHPVLKRRLLEILDAIEARRVPVSGDRHFTRNFRVTSFVRTHQVAIVEVAEPRDTKQDQQRGDDTRPGNGGYKHQVVRFHCLLIFRW